MKYCEIREILPCQYFLDFTIFHNVSHVSQYCTLYCTAPVCKCSSNIQIRISARAEIKEDGCEFPSQFSQLMLTIALSTRLI